MKRVIFRALVALLFILPAFALAQNVNPLFVQSGTGAQSRTLHDKGRDQISAFDFMTAAQIADVRAGTASIDVGAALQKAINAAAVRCRAVYLPQGVYKVATASGSTVTMPSGSTMPYAIELKKCVRLYGETPDGVTIIGPWTYRTTAVNASQLICIRLSDTPGGGSFYLENLTIRNFMIGVFHSGIVSGYAKHITFGGVGIWMITQQVERFEWDSIDGDMGAGLVNGGWWVTAGTQVSGGWVDKSQFKRIHYMRTQTGWTATENNIDTFFDTNFFRHTLTYDGTTPGRVVPYRGIVGIPIVIIAARNRPNFNVEIADLFAYGNPRPAVYGGPEYTWTVKNINLERVGYVDYTLGQVMGVGVADPWNATKAKAALEIYSNSQASTFQSIYATNLAAIDLVSTGLGNYLGMRAIAVANKDLTHVPQTNTMP